MTDTGKKLIRCVTLGLLVCSSFSAGCRSETETAADLLLVNGRVYSLAWGEPSADGAVAADAPRDTASWQPDAEAVAVADGRIVFVGW